MLYSSFFLLLFCSMKQAKSASVVLMKLSPYQGLVAVCTAAGGRQNHEDISSALRR